MARGKGTQLKQMAAQSSQGSPGKSMDPSEMTPKQLRMQASQMRKLGPVALRKRVPEMKNATDEEIEASIVQLERMADDPEFRSKAQKQAKNFTAADRELTRKKPEDMTPQEFHRLISLQRDMLKTDPEAFWTQMEKNPQTAGMSRTQMEQQINQMANMTPEELSTYMTVSKTMKPLQDGMQKFDKMTYGYGRYLVWALIAYFAIHLIRTIAGLGVYFLGSSVPLDSGLSDSNDVQDQAQSEEL